VESADSEIDEDGPLFRATLRALEKRSFTLRRSLKAVLKAAEAVITISSNLEEAEYKVDAAIRELAETNPSTVQALIEAYWGEASLKKALRRREEREMFQRDVVAPLSAIVADLKAVDARKKVWEGESKEYYDHLAKYLAGPSTTATNDAIAKADDKHVARRERFSRARREYHSALTELSLFRESDVLALLARHAHAEHDLFVAAAADLAATGDLSALDKRVEEQARYVDARREELQLRRQADEPADETSSVRASVDMSAPGSSDGFRGRLKSSLHQLAKTSLDLAQPSSSSKGKTKTPKHTDKFRGIRDLEVPRAGSPNPTRKKEGFLWATTRPSAHQASSESASGVARAWHKFWVVLAGGKLAEYRGWRESLEVHGTPINLRFATVRESRAPDGRRFTFEVLTPQVRRIYQATSDGEARQWIEAISNNIESLLNGLVRRCYEYFLDLGIVLIGCYKGRARCETWRFCARAGLRRELSPTSQVLVSTLPDNHAMAWDRERHQKEHGRQPCPWAGRAADWDRCCLAGASRSSADERLSTRSARRHKRNYS
jgi:Arf-GAP/SH3 domain/ANK repeat/PH domain-containing protein